MKEKQIKIISVCTGIICILAIIGAGYIFDYYLNEPNNESSFSALTSEENKETESKATEEVNKEIDTVPYDPSSLNQINLNELLGVLNSDELNITLIGRKTCPYCVDFLPIVVEVNNEYNLNINYLNILEIDYASNDYKLLLEKDEFLHSRFGYIPMILISKNKSVVNGFTGAKSKSEFISYLKKYKII